VVSLLDAMAALEYELEMTALPSTTGDTRQMKDIIMHKDMSLPSVSPESPFDPVHLYRILYEHYGPSHWWPGDTPFEVMVGAVLTQNTAWTNVEKAIANLKAAGLLDAAAVHDADPSYLAGLLRPSGYYNIKTSRLKNLVHMIITSYSGNLEELFSQDP
jgi:endonuclease-3 related protein